MFVFILMQVGCVRLEFVQKRLLIAVREVEIVNSEPLNENAISLH